MYLGTVVCPTVAPGAQVLGILIWNTTLLSCWFRRLPCFCGAALPFSRPGDAGRRVYVLNASLCCTAQLQLAYCWSVGCCVRQMILTCQYARLYFVLVLFVSGFSWVVRSLCLWGLFIRGISSFTWPRHSCNFFDNKTFCRRDFFVKGPFC